MESNILENKKGQVTIFVIIGMVIVISAILVFIFIGNPFNYFTIDENPKEKIESQMYETLEDSIDKTLENKGYFNEINKNYLVYSGKRIPYLCTVSQFYIPCTPQEPMFVSKIKENIKESLKEEIKKEFSEIEKNYKKPGYEIKTQKPGIEIYFKENSLVATSNGSITIIKGESVNKYSEFQVEIKTSIYELAKTAQKIVNYESTLCEFDRVKWQALHPEIEIKKFRASDQTKIYTLKSRNSKEEIKFAIKTCVLPAGI